MYDILGYVMMFLIFVCIIDFKKTKLDFEVDYRRNRGL